VYETLTTKPISLLEAVAEDAPIGSSARGSAVSAPRLPTTADGVSATMLSGGPLLRTQMPRLRVVAIGGAALFVALIGVVGGLRMRSAAEVRGAASAEPVAASASLVPSSTASAVSTMRRATVEQLVVPLERLPIASAAPPSTMFKELSRKQAETGRQSALPTVAPGGEPTRVAPVPQPASEPADPYATRH
jgi:hypothetical protein